MEAVLAIVVLVGVLTASGVLPNDAATKASTAASVSEISTLTAPEGRPACGEREQQPRYRDLTIAYEQQIAQRSAIVADGCDD